MSEAQVMYPLHANEVLDTKRFELELYELLDEPMADWIERRIAFIGNQAIWNLDAWFSKQRGIAAKKKNAAALKAMTSKEKDAWAAGKLQKRIKSNEYKIAALEKRLEKIRVEREEEDKLMRLRRKRYNDRDAHCEDCIWKNINGCKGMVYTYNTNDFTTLACYYLDATGNPYPPPTNPGTQSMKDVRNAISARIARSKNGKTK